MRGVGVKTVGTDAGQAATFDLPFPNHYLMHGSGKFGLAGLSNLDRLPPTGAIVVCRATENRGRLRQPSPSHCDHTVKHREPPRLLLRRSRHRASWANLGWPTIQTY